MFDLISIGTISVDFFFKGESLTFKDGRFQLALGGKYSVPYFHHGVGGGGVNVAVGLERHGLEAAVIGKIGQNEFKQMILNTLERESVYHRYCTIEDDYYNVSSILLHEDGERTVLHHQTPHVHSFETEAELKPLQNATAVYIGNIADHRLHTREKIIFHLRRHKIPIIMNFGAQECALPKHHLIDFVRMIDVLIVNGHEFAQMVKAPYGDIDFSESVVQHYIPQLSHRLIVVTEGAAGSYAYLQDLVFHQPIVKPHRIIDTTGAGDGYTAGFIAKYLQTHNIRDAMHTGATYAARIIAKIGAN